VIDVAVDTAAGQPVMGLQRHDFAWRQGNRSLTRWEVLESQRTSQAASVVLCLDRSGSMQGAPLLALQQASARFVEDLVGVANIELLSFADQVTVDRAWTRDLGLLQAGLEKLRAEGGTALGQAISRGIQELAGRPGRRVLVVFTDGQDSFGALDTAALVKFARQQQVTIHGVLLKTAQFDHAALQQIAQATGGLVVSVDQPGALGAQFQVLAKELKRPLYRFVLLDADPQQPLSLSVGDAPPVQIELRSRRTESATR
jgi:VWFA-related protein